MIVVPVSARAPGAINITIARPTAHERAPTGAARRSQIGALSDWAVLIVGLPTLTTTPGEAESCEGFCEALRPGIVTVGQDVLRAPLPPARAHGAIGGEPAYRGRERRHVAGGHDQAVVPVADQAAGGGADGIACDHRQPAVHRLVDHQAPGLAKGASGDR